jgi:hypothetical protein
MQLCGYCSAPAELDDADRFQAQLAEAVQAAVTASLTPPNGQHHHHQQQQQHVAAFVSDAAAFPGCWQLVMQLVLPAGQQVQLQQQALQQAAQQVLAAWQECSLHSMQLLSIEPAAATPAVEVTNEATGREVQPAQQQLPSVAAELPHLQPVALNIADNSSSSSSSSATAGAATAELWIPAAQVQQLVEAGKRSVRVVVTPAQLPAGQLLLDKTWQLPSTAAAAAGYEEDTAGGQLPLTAAAAAVEAGAALPVHTAASERTHKPLRLQLQLPLGSAAASAATLTPATAAASVLSVTLLVGGDAAPAGNVFSASPGTGAAGSPRSAAAAASAAAELSEPQLAAEHNHRPAHVLAKLPLLLLPAAAADELQQLYTALIAAGSSCL